MDDGHYLGYITKLKKRSSWLLYFILFSVLFLVFMKMRQQMFISYNQGENKY